VTRRQDRQRFWAAIAGGSSSEQAGVAGVSPAVGVRWFREGGGMPSVSRAPLSGRYLLFAEREEIAILRPAAAACVRPPDAWVDRRRRRYRWRIVRSSRAAQSKCAAAAPTSSLVSRTPSFFQCRRAPAASA
jgi:hypothetical protein